MRAADVLKTARALIATRGGWGQNTFARDNKGVSVDMYSERACTFCASGAVRRAGGANSRAVLSALNALTKVIEKRTGVDYASIAEYNDTHTKRSILSMFDEAIKAVSA